MNSPAREDYSSAISSGCAAFAGTAAIRHHDRIDGSESAPGLAERTRGQEMPVAQAPLRIDDGDLVLTRESQVLKTVVAHDDLRSGRYRRAGGSGPVAADEHELRAAVRVQNRLVTCDRRIGIPRDLERRPRVPPAVTAQDDGNNVASGTQLRREPACDRRLARAAHGEVADDYHGRTRILALEKTVLICSAPPPHDQPVERFERPERRGTPRGSVPQAEQAALQAHSLNCIR